MGEDKNINGLLHRETRRRGKGMGSELTKLPVPKTGSKKSQIVTRWVAAHGTSVFLFHTHPGCIVFLFCFRKNESKKTHDIMPPHNGTSFDELRDARSIETTHGTGKLLWLERIFFGRHVGASNKKIRVAGQVWRPARAFRTTPEGERTYTFSWPGIMMPKRGTNGFNGKHKTVQNG